MSHYKLRDCEVCGTPYHATYREQRTCSRTCGVIINAYTQAARTNPYEPAPKKRKPYIRKTHTCQVCGRASRQDELWQTHCSSECVRRSTSQRISSLYAMARANGTGATTWWHDLVMLVAKRDGSDCAMCAQPVDVTVVSGVKGNEDGPSLDHIIPRSKGGSDDIDNLQLTHWRCNRDARTKKEKPKEKADFLVG